MASPVPAELRREPTVRPSGDAPCRTCGLPYDVHTQLCACCGQYIEHHDDHGTAACIAGQRRMAEARRAAGVALDDVDRFVLADRSSPTNPMPQGGTEP